MDALKVSTINLANNAYKQQIATPVPAISRTKGEAVPQVPTDTRAASDTVQVRSSVSLKNLDTVRAIEQMYASLNQLAKGVRETNESINAAVDQVDTMRNGIQGVVKNYPPFPIDSKERNDRLMEYTSLRKELLSLMVPTPPVAPYEKVKLMWSSLFDSNGKIQQSLVPELSKGSSDAQLTTASQTLEKTSSQLSEFSNKVTQALVQP